MGEGKRGGQNERKERVGKGKCGGARQRLSLFRKTNIGRM